MMRRVVSTAVLGIPLVLALWTASASAQLTATEREAAEEAIRASAKRYSDAYMRKDSQAMADLWTEDAIYVNSRGVVVHGRQALELTFAESIKDAASDRQHEDVIEELHFIAPTVVFRRGKFRISDGVGNRDHWGIYTSVMVRRGGKWLIASVHSAVPPIE